jgi:hypothetical protein
VAFVEVRNYMLTFFSSFFVLQEGLIVNIKPRDGSIEEQQANEGAEKESNGY